MTINKIDGFKLQVIFKSAAEKLEENKEEVNSLNVFPVPDGDTGTNMLLTMKSALKQALSVEKNDASLVAQAASQGSLMGARGNSGVILSQLFRGFATGIGEKDTIDSKIFALALKSAADTAYKAVMKPTEGTILTVARECGEFAISNSSNYNDLSTFLEEIIKHGNKILDKTPDMLPVLKQAGVVDAGGKGLIYLFIGMHSALNDENRSLVTTTQNIVEPIIIKKTRPSIDTDNIEFGYCTEFMINTGYKDVENFRDDISVFGDSLLVVGGEGLIKVHIHTNNPGQVLEKALSLGGLSDIKIDNMRYQHEEILLKDELLEMSKKTYNTNEKKEYSIVAISVGEGIDALFKDLNVDVIVSGGQTMNPSTEDILSAIESTTGNNVIVLPNNSNIILSAEQTKHLSNRNISVVPTKSIPQGLAALIALDEELGIEENIQRMNESLENVLTGQVTFAVRDTEFNGNSIKKDDIIGLSDKDILSSGSNITQVSLSLLKKLINEDTSIITIIYGNDVSETDANNLAEKVTAEYGDIDIELVYGGQPLYFYLFAVE
ncbi:MAG: DAK2 domain-containing protein [Gudongella sp.]|nr:DAK2 domain-containing protein [Gudongella sp.]